MEVFHWVLEKGFDIISSIGIIGGLIFTAVSLRSETKTRKIANLLTITTNHRDIWKEFFPRPELARVLDAFADVNKRPITPEEKEFVNFVILHLSSVYYALKDEILIKLEGLRRDTSSFFSLPIPRLIWNETKRFQNQDFVKFVEECVRGGPSS